MKFKPSLMDEGNGDSIVFEKMNTLRVDVLTEFAVSVVLRVRFFVPTSLLEYAYRIIVSVPTSVSNESSAKSANDFKAVPLMFTPASIVSSSSCSILIVCCVGFLK